MRKNLWIGKITFLRKALKIQIIDAYEFAQQQDIALLYMQNRSW